MACLVAERLVLLQLPTGQVVEPRQLEGLVQVIGRLAPAVQQLQVALLCSGGRGQAGGPARRLAGLRRKHGSANSRAG